jgi:hypothetical protein
LNTTEAEALGRAFPQEPHCTPQATRVSRVLVIRVILGANAPVTTEIETLLGRWVKRMGIGQAITPFEKWEALHVTTCGLLVLVVD